MDVGKLEAFVAARTRASRVEARNPHKLGGGAIQENWSVDLVLHYAGSVDTMAVVVRCDAASGVSESRSRAEEFALLSAAYEAGVRVPEPLWIGDESVLGWSFLVMRRVDGTTAGHRIVRDLSLGGDRARLTRRLGEEIGKIQRVRPSNRLGFLVRSKQHPALELVHDGRAQLDALGQPHPALEWGLRWLERNVPDLEAWSEDDLVLAHRDFRTGNVMIDRQGLVAILDWEFCDWSHPLEDLGWLCARCWRFGQRGDPLAAGGVGSREDLLAGYNRITGRGVVPEDLHYWEVLAEARWALIALAQAERHRSGREPSLELALTGHIVPELELHLLRMTGVDFASAGSPRPHA